MAEYLATVDALSDLIGEDSHPDDTQLPAALAMASAMIRAESGQTFTQTSEEDVLLPGTYTTELLTPRFPVVDVSLVETLAWGAEDYVEDDPADYVWYSDGRIIRLDGASWGGPRSSVRLAYEHGYAAVPDEIEQITLAVAKRLVVFGSRFGDQQVQDPAAGVSVGLTRLERRIVCRYRPVPVA